MNIVIGTKRESKINALKMALERLNINDYNIIWVFNFEDNEEYVNLHNLMCKDIYYANKRNVFIFDSD